MTTNPEIFRTTVRCSTCGTSFETRSTRADIVVDVCSSCHPAYTGVHGARARSNRIDDFNRRRARARLAQ